tara:strand:- start:4071 stop:4796 length:726 start_codon:yes stop_codon:yes gene_type:complete
MGWFSDALFGEKKRIDQNKINGFMSPYNQMIDEQEDIAREMMNPNSRLNMQQRQATRMNQMDLAATQNQGLLSAAAMGGVSSGQAAMQARGNMNTARAQMGQQFSQMNQAQYTSGLGLLQNVAGMRQGEGERLSNMHIQEVNAHNAARQANMQMVAQMAGSAAQAAGMAMSDRRFKKNINLVGKSPTGINIYEFEYKDKSCGYGRYSGVMADEVPQASLRDKDGYLYVDYNKLDVEFKRIN